MMEKRTVNINRALKRQEIINRWTNCLILNEIRRLKHQKTMSNDMITQFETKLSELTNDNYRDTMKFLETVLNSVETIIFNI